MLKEKYGGQLPMEALGFNWSGVWSGCEEFYKLPSESNMHTVFFILKFYLLIYFWPRLAACRILVPWPGIEPMPPEWKCRVLTNWITREVLYYAFKKPVVLGIFHLPLQSHSPFFSTLLSVPRRLSWIDCNNSLLCPVFWVNSANGDRKRMSEE